jgi:hypothetical protein
MVQEARTKIPSATNVHESTLGHLNGAMTRPNSFWTVLFPINDVFRHNRNRATRYSPKRSCSVSLVQISEEANELNITLEEPQCEETYHLAAMNGTLLPYSRQCSHIDSLVYRYAYLTILFSRGDIPARRYACPMGAGSSTIRSQANVSENREFHAFPRHCGGVVSRNIIFKE